jgi:CheY-like chemotaxis protein
MTLNISSLELTGKHIVIVEDDLPSIKYYKILLKNSGAEVSIFRTGKEFIDYINLGNYKIDLIFMDFLIPLINGIECTRLFRQEKKKGTPVIMITAYSSEQAKNEAYIAGCNEYILKPIYPEKIILLLEKYLISEIPVSLKY